MNDNKTEAQRVLLKIMDQTGYVPPQKKCAEKPVCLDVLNEIHDVQKNPSCDVTNEDINLIERAVAHIYGLNADMALLIERAFQGQSVNYALMAPHILNFVNPDIPHTPEFIAVAIKLAPHMIAITARGDSK